MRKHAEKYSTALNEVMGRMYACMGIMIAGAYAGKWFIERKPHLHAEYPVTICIALVTAALPLWPLAYARTVFPYIYRYCILKKRSQNKYVMTIFAIPVMLIAVTAWMFFCIFRYNDIIDELFRQNKIKPYIALISGEGVLLIICIVMWARITARRRGFSLGK